MPEVKNPEAKLPLDPLTVPAAVNPASGDASARSNTGGNVPGRHSVLRALLRTRSSTFARPTASAAVPDSVGTELSWAVPGAWMATTGGVLSKVKVKDVTGAL